MYVLVIPRARGLRRLSHRKVCASLHQNPNESSAVRKLDALRLAQEKSEKAILSIQDEEMSRRMSDRKVLDIEDNQASTSGPRTVDIRMYEGLAASRNRLSKKVTELHKSNRLVTEQLGPIHYIPVRM